MFSVTSADFPFVYLPHNRRPWWWFDSSEVAGVSLIPWFIEQLHLRVQLGLQILVTNAFAQRGCRRGHLHPSGCRLCSSFHPFVCSCHFLLFYMTRHYIWCDDPNTLYIQFVSAHPTSIMVFEHFAHCLNCWLRISSSSFLAFLKITKIRRFHVYLRKALSRGSNWGPWKTTRKRNYTEEGEQRSWATVRPLKGATD